MAPFLDISLEFWSFIEAVAANPHLVGDDIKSLPSFGDLSQAIYSSGNAYALRGGGGDMYMPCGDNAPLPLPGVSWDGDAGVWVFDDMEAVFYGTREVLREDAATSSSVRSRLLLSNVDLCFGKIQRWLSVVSLACDMERGL
jgi:hypothetical protein